MNYDVINRKNLEKSILSCLLIDSSTIELLIKHNLRSDYFVFDNHKDVFIAIENTIKKGEIPNIISVNANKPLKYKNNDVDKFDYYLVELSNFIGSTIEFEHWVLKLKEYIIYDYWNGLEFLKKDFNWELVDVFNYSENIINGYNNLINNFKLLYPKNYNYEEVLLKKVKDFKDGKNPGLYTGIKTFDNNYNGLHSPDLIIIAARPGMGKTTLAYSISYNFSKTLPGLYVALEASVTQAQNKIISKMTNIDYKSIRDGRNLSKDDIQKIIYTQKLIDGSNLQFKDDIRTIEQLEILCDRMYKENALKWLVIDYLQLFGVSDKTSNREGEISKISRTLKAIAIKYDIPVIALSQLSRKVEERKPPIPILSDLRESGAIEQDADVVLFLYREGYYKQLLNPGIDIDYDDLFQTKLIIAKHREGALDTYNIFIDPKKILAK